jgi:type II secretory pathway pseudopilin PulG
MRKQAGYTIVELLAVLIVIVAIGSLIVGIIFFTLRSNTKTQINLDISQNGNYALSVISKLLLNATSVTINGSACSANPSGTNLTIQALDGGSTTFVCDVENNNISSNSASLIDPSRVQLVSCTFSCSQTSNFIPAKVSISIALRQKTSSPLPEFLSTSSFSTTVSLRNTTLRSQ